MRCSAPLCNSSPALTCYIRRIQRSCRQRVQVCCPGRNTNNRKHNEDDDRGKVRRPVGRRVRVRVWVVSWLSLFFSQRLCCQHIPLSSSTAHLSLPPPLPDLSLRVFDICQEKIALLCVCFLATRYVTHLRHFRRRDSLPRPTSLSRPIAVWLSFTPQCVSVSIHSLSFCFCG